MNFMGLRRRFLGLSGALVALSLILLFVPGLNLGIDFAGGTILERAVDRPVTAGEIRDVLANDVGDLGLSNNAVIQVLGDNNDFIIRTRSLENSEIARV